MPPQYKSALLAHSLDECSPDQKAYIALRLAEKTAREFAIARFLDGLENCATAAIALGTLFILLNPGANHFTTQWYQGIKWLHWQEARAAEVKPTETVFPVQGRSLATANLTSPFGAQEGFRKEPHAGVDFGLPVGTPVLAPEAGVIARVWEQTGRGGKVVEFVPDSDSTKTIKFLHLSAQDVREGQRVKAGDRIGATGNTGFSTGPHLDIRIQKNGQWINPMPYLQSLGK